MANKLIAYSAYTEFVNRQTSLESPHQGNGVACQPGKLVYPVSIQRPRVFGRDTNPCGSAFPTKYWSSSFQVYSIDSVGRIACPVIQGSLSLSFDTTPANAGGNVSPDDVRDTLLAFIGEFDNDGTFIGSNGFNGGAALAYNTATI